MSIFTKSSPLRQPNRSASLLITQVQAWAATVSPIDPFYLTWKAREYGVNTRFIELAGEVNSHMPDYVIEKVGLALNDHNRSIKDSKILVLGIAYKKNVDDMRESRL